MNTTRELPVKLSDEKKSRLGEELAHQLTERDLIRAEKRSAIADANERIKEIDQMVTKLTQSIETGSELREVKCLERVSPTNGSVEVVRLDTGEIVETIHDPERAAKVAQAELPFGATPATSSAPVEAKPLERPGRACPTCSVADGTHAPDCVIAFPKCEYDVLFSADGREVYIACGKPATHHIVSIAGDPFVAGDSVPFCEKHAGDACAAEDALVEPLPPLAERMASYCGGEDENDEPVDATPPAHDRGEHGTGEPGIGLGEDKCEYELTPQLADDVRNGKDVQVPSMIDAGASVAILKLVRHDADAPDYSTAAKVAEEQLEGDKPKGKAGKKKGSSKKSAKAPDAPESAQGEAGAHA